MVIKTKKYQLPTQTYVRIAFAQAMKEFWWAWFVPVGIMLIPLLYAPAFWWCFSIALLLSVLYLLFWWAQFTAATQIEQNKMMFDKMSYEIDSRQILIKLRPDQGAPLGWDKIQGAVRTSEAFVLHVSRGQFLYLPLSIFSSDLNIQHLETILKRKDLLNRPLTSWDRLIGRFSRQKKTTVGTEA